MLHGEFFSEPNKGSNQPLWNAEGVGGAACWAFETSPVGTSNARCQVEAGARLKLCLSVSRASLAEPGLAPGEELFFPSWVSQCIPVLSFSLSPSASWLLKIKCLVGLDDHQLLLRLFLHQLLFEALPPCLSFPRALQKV